MIKIKKIVNVLLTILFIFRLPRDKPEAKEIPSQDRKYSTISLLLDKKTDSAKPVEKETVISDVSIVKGDNLYAMTKEALSLIGGMKKIVKKGDKVFIKPNYISGGLDGHDPVAAGEIAHPEVVASVSEECLRAGAKEVVIGEWVERPIKINFGGREGKEGAQIQHLVNRLNKKYGNRIFLINLMEYTSYFKYVPSRSKLKLLAIPNIVAEADVIISIPALKTHHKPCPVSLGMKNFMGIMPSVIYGEPRFKLHEAGLHQVIVDINKALKPSLTVVSGGFGMEGRGASLFLGGKAVDVSKKIGGFLVIAGRDPVATDATATRLITKDWNPKPSNPDLGTPWYVNHIRMASEQGLGNLNSSNIIIQGEKIEDVMMNWEQSDDFVYPENPDSL
ncbi:MAG: DUF362 domain-containing protein [Candidatus Omnitrophota bacterium]|nr:DUF362 domain-containing protein [Candidatus Omnitrophota bacterium]